MITKRQLGDPVPQHTPMTPATTDALLRTRHQQVMRFRLTEAQPTISLMDALAMIQAQQLHIEALERAMLTLMDNLYSGCPLDKTVYRELESDMLLRDSNG